MAEGKEECAAQFSGLQGKHSKCSNHSIWCKPGSGLDTGVVRGVGSAHTAGQKHLGCLLFWLEFPGDPKALPRARLPRAWCLGLRHLPELRLKTRLFQAPLWWGREAGPPVKMPVFDPNKL